MSDKNNVFSGIKCIACGDSLLSVQNQNWQQAVKWWEMLSGQYETSRTYGQKGTTNYYKCPELATGLDCYNGRDTVSGLYARGGTGYWKADPFYVRLANMHTDPDIVIMYGSINDHTFRVSGNTGSDYWPNPNYGYLGGVMHTAVGKYFKNDSMTGTYGDQLTWAEPSADDLNTDSLHYYSQYISKAIFTAHEKAPNAKIVMVNPWMYVVEHSTRTNRRTRDIDWARYVMYDYIRRTVPGASNWLYYYGESQDFSGTTYANGRYTQVLGSFKEGPMRVDDWDGGSTKRPFGYYPEENGYNFGVKYVYDYLNSSGNVNSTCGHANTLTNEICFAPTMAHIICDVMGISYANLPDGLKFPDDPDFPTTYTATFFAEGFGVVDTVEFEAGATVLPRVPTVPYKEGYTGEWEPYTLSDANITINARYTPVQPDAIAYDINGDEIYNAYDINGASIAKLYDINGESLV